MLTSMAPTNTAGSPKSRKPRRALEGKTFGFYQVVKYVGGSSWECRCKCGNVRRVLTGNLTSGQSKSCGCLNAELTRQRMTRHGLADTYVHRVWMSMLQRCNNSSDHAFKNYGGRGIRVCNRWLVFENFLADMGQPPEKTTIDRINNNGNYEPGNCRWATRHQQARNQRTNRFYTVGGITLCRADWIIRAGITDAAFRGRQLRGWSIERIVTTPLLTKGWLEEHGERRDPQTGKSAKVLRLPVIGQRTLF